MTSEARPKANEFLPEDAREMRAVGASVCVQLLYCISKTFPSIKTLKHIMQNGAMRKLGEGEVWRGGG